jgi:hypothetical protein
MAARIKSTAHFPAYDRIRRIQDFYIVSSFVLWATLLGFGPIVTYRLLLG